MGRRLMHCHRGLAPRFSAVITPRRWSGWKSVCFLHTQAVFLSSAVGHVQQQVAGCQGLSVITCTSVCKNCQVATSDDLHLEAVGLALVCDLNTLHCLLIVACNMCATIDANC